MKNEVPFNLRDHIHRGLVDKAEKTFNIADKFVTHSIWTHMIAVICSHLGMSKPTDPLVHWEGHGSSLHNSS